jgi:hypothetical protein
MNGERGGGRYLGVEDRESREIVAGSEITEFLCMAYEEHPNAKGDVAGGGKWVSLDLVKGCGLWIVGLQWHNLIPQTPGYIL